MTDNHIHIGRFRDVYYNPVEIVDVAMAAGMENISISSTSSCEDNIRYSDIEREILSLLSYADYPSDSVNPYFWYIPDYMNQNVTAEKAFTTVPYKGIKLHPLSQNWDFDNTRQVDALYTLFDFAAQGEFPVLIHTGHSGIDSADRFERFICEYSVVRCILAHCRPLDVTIKMLRKYNNAYCDTAFASPADIQQIISAGFADRIILGSDFPITHYFKTHYPQSDDDSKITLKEQYADDIAGWTEILEKLHIATDGIVG